LLKWCELKLFGVCGLVIELALWWVIAQRVGDVCRRCAVPVGVLYWSVCCTGGCVVPVGVLYLSVCCTGRCVLPVGVLYRSVCCTGRCAVPVGVLHRSVCCTGRCVVFDL